MCRSRRELSNEYYLQNLASIQPRTSLVKFARSPRIIIIQIPQVAYYFEGFGEKARGSTIRPDVVEVNSRTAQSNKAKMQSGNAERKTTVFFRDSDHDQPVNVTSAEGDEMSELSGVWPEPADTNDYLKGTSYDYDTAATLGLYE